MKVKEQKAQHNVQSEINSHLLAAVFPLIQKRRSVTSGGEKTKKLLNNIQQRL